MKSSFSQENQSIVADGWWWMPGAEPDAAEATDWPLGTCRRRPRHGTSQECFFSAGMSGSCSQHSRKTSKNHWFSLKFRERTENLYTCRRVSHVGFPFLCIRKSKSFRASRPCNSWLTRPTSPVEAKILRSDGMVDGMRPRVSRVVFELNNFPFLSISSVVRFLDSL